MKFHLRQMKFSKYNLTLFVIGMQVLVNDAVGHRCYVCGVDKDLNCDNFDTSNREIYAKECPSRYKSCSIQTHGKAVSTRSCELIKLDDCQIANDVKYCYCSEDLCNSFNKELKLINPSDDDEEDLEDLEGSGTKNTIIPTTSVTDDYEKKIKKKTSSASKSVYVNMIYLSITIVLCYNIH